MENVEENVANNFEENPSPRDPKKKKKILLASLIFALVLLLAFFFIFLLPNLIRKEGPKISYEDQAEIAFLEIYHDYFCYVYDNGTCEKGYVDTKNELINFIEENKEKYPNIAIRASSLLASLYNNNDRYTETIETLENSLSYAENDDETFGILVDLIYYSEQHNDEESEKKYLEQMLNLNGLKEVSEESKDEYRNYYSQLNSQGQNE